MEAVIPLYDFEDTNTGEVFEKQITIANREIYLKDNPHIRQLPAAPGLHSGIGLGGGMKHSDTFNDVLKEIKSKHSDGHRRAGRFGDKHNLTQSTINTK